MFKKLVSYSILALFSCCVNAQEYINFNMEYGENLSVYDYRQYDFTTNPLSETYGKVLYSNGLYFVDQFSLEQNIDNTNLIYPFALNNSKTLKFTPLYKLANLSNQPLETNNMFFEAAAISSKNQDVFKFREGASCIINSGFWFSEPVFLIDLRRPVIEEDSLSMYEKKQQDKYGDNFIKSQTGTWQGLNWVKIELIGYQGKSYTISAVKDGDKLRYADYYNKGDNYTVIQDCIAYNTEAIEDIKQNIHKLNTKRSFLENLFK